MNCQCNLGRLCAVCGMLAYCGASAADINRCRDSEGRVLLTDQPCVQQGLAIDEAATETVPSAAVAPPAEVADGVDRADVIAGTRDEQEPAAEPKRSPWADLPHPVPRRPVTLDVSTLQAARSAMLVQDELRRQRKVVSVR